MRSRSEEYLYLTGFTKRGHPLTSTLKIEAEEYTFIECMNIRLRLMIKGQFWKQEKT